MLDLLSEKLTRPIRFISFTATLIVFILIDEIKVGWNPLIQFIGGYLRCTLKEIENGVETKRVEKYEHAIVTFEPSNFIALETFDDYPRIGNFSVNEKKSFTGNWNNFKH